MYRGIYLQNCVYLLGSWQETDSTLKWDKWRELNEGLSLKRWAGLRETDKGEGRNLRSDGDTIPP